MNQQDNTLNSKSVKKKSKKKLIIFIILFTSIASVIASGIIISFNKEPSSITVEKRNIKETIDVSGIVQSEHNITIKSETTGVVTKRFVEENISISQNKQLVSINEKKSKLTLEQAYINSNSNQAQAQTELDSSKKSLHEAESRYKTNIINLENQISKAKSALNFLEKEQKRNEKLFSEKAISSQTLDNQKQQINQAKIDLKTVIDNLERAKKDKTEIVNAQNKLKQTHTALNNAIKQGQIGIDIAQDSFEKTLIYAPFKGTITKWLINKGDFVNIGTPICQFQDLDDIRLQLSVNELDLPKISSKSQVSIIFDAYPDKQYKGKIAWISQASVTSSDGLEVFPVEVSFENPNRLIKPGMSGDAKIIIMEKSKVIAIPLASINRKDNKLFVKIVKDKKLTEVEVKTGISDFEYIEIISGLKEGDKIFKELEKKTLEKNESKK